MPLEFHTILRGIVFDPDHGPHGAFVEIEDTRMHDGLDAPSRRVARERTGNVWLVENGSAKAQRAASRIAHAAVGEWNADRANTGPFPLHA